jgi:hypothetical protein
MKTLSGPPPPFAASCSYLDILRVSPKNLSLREKTEKVLQLFNLQLLPLVSCQNYYYWGNQSIIGMTYL